MSLANVASSTIHTLGGWFSAPIHIILSLILIAFFGAIGTGMANRLFSAAEPKKKIIIQRLHSSRTALFEALEEREHVMILQPVRDSDDTQDFVRLLKANGWEESHFYWV